jgi:ribonuclease Z
MSSRELIALGTASQVPTRRRAHNAYFLRWDELGFLFDPGEGTQRQLTFADVAPSAVDHIAITHFHGDHCLGLAGMIQRLSLDNVAHPVRVHFPASGAAFVDRMRHASLYYPSPALRLELAPIAERSGLQVAWENERLRLLVHPLDHGVPTIGYRLEEKGRLAFIPEKLAELGISGPKVGELQRAGKLTVGERVVTREEVSRPRVGQVFAFVMDTRPCAGATELARGADLLVMEATYTAADQALASDHGHSSAADAARVAKEAGVRQLALTHFSQRYESADQHLADAQAIFPASLALDDLTRLPMPARPE